MQSVPAVNRTRHVGSITWVRYRWAMSPTGVEPLWSCRSMLQQFNVSILLIFLSSCQLTIAARTIGFITMITYMFHTKRKPCQALKLPRLTTNVQRAQLLAILQVPTIRPFLFLSHLTPTVAVWVEILFSSQRIAVLAYILVNYRQHSALAEHRNHEAIS